MNKFSIIPFKRRQNNDKEVPKSSTKYLPYMICGAILSPLLIVSACNSDLDSEKNLSEFANSDSQSILAKEQRNADTIEESIKNSHASLAAQRSDICPKLIQKNVDETTISRTAEVMVYNYCEYYLYPEKGQSIDVDINTDQIETLLIVPTLHNFANGSYQVASYDKHVIRLNYNGGKHKPERFTYDVAITVNESSH